ncbi:agmatine deiminase family protein [Lacihabitans sp. LS3-19]|uniref:agmatine deiminase family protein n=1 Tax=Lacihabitans sp. LS3-19 TaxID=2487335 RepID=UPI0020CF0176|nr:agmatine deiminase family protein [Lacihabitans sp. LS3-19]MCP9766981.1 agmatine deiminase family protein [Lacihabitans sp. LS3-19]
MRNPKNENFYFPAEWHPHEATWLSFPINKETWENRFEKIYPSYLKFISTISKSELVKINANNAETILQIEKLFEKFKIDTTNIRLYNHATNDSWCRDHGPAILINRNNSERLIIDWEYNAWGGKYPPFDSDNGIPKKIAKLLELPYVSPGIIMEGGSVEFNGSGSVMTSKSCLLNKNRNPSLDQSQIENYLCTFYGVNQVLWIEDGIIGDDTDGHIDDTVRFVAEDRIITMIEKNKSDENHLILEENLKLLKKMRLLNGKQLEIVEIEMPEPVIDNGERLPASYANFCITNKNVIVPTYRCKNDDKALNLIQACFKDREVIGIDSTDIIWGLGSFHCLSQQEPKATLV